MSGVVPLEEAHEEALFGAKAVGLGEAARAGLPLPPGVALTGAPRNDENLIVSGLALGALKYHNRVVDALPSDVPKDERFREANRIVRWHD